MTDLRKGVAPPIRKSWNQSPESEEFHERPEDVALEASRNNGVSWSLLARVAFARTQIEERAVVVHADSTLTKFVDGCACSREAFCSRVHLSCTRDVNDGCKRGAAKGSIDQVQSVHTAISAPEQIQRLPDNVEPAVAKSDGVERLVACDLIKPDSVEVYNVSRGDNVSFRRRLYKQYFVAESPAQVHSHVVDAVGCGIDADSDHDLRRSILAREYFWEGTQPAFSEHADQDLKKENRDLRNEQDGPFDGANNSRTIANTSGPDPCEVIFFSQAIPRKRRGSRLIHTNVLVKKQNSCTVKKPMFAPANILLIGMHATLAWVLIEFFVNKAHTLKRSTYIVLHYAVIVAVFSIIFGFYYSYAPERDQFWTTSIGMTFVLAFEFVIFRYLYSGERWFLNWIDWILPMFVAASSIYFIGAFFG